MKKLTKEVVYPGGYKQVELTENELLNDIALTNRRISNNVAFFFWLTIFGIVSYAVFAMIIYS